MYADNVPFMGAFLRMKYFFFIDGNTREIGNSEALLRKSPSQCLNNLLLSDWDADDEPTTGTAGAA